MEVGFDGNDAPATIVYKGVEVPYSIYEAVIGRSETYYGREFWSNDYGLGLREYFGNAVNEAQLRERVERSLVGLPKWMIDRISVSVIGNRVSLSYRERQV